MTFEIRIHLQDLSIQDDIILPHEIHLAPDHVITVFNGEPDVQWDTLLDCLLEHGLTPNGFVSFLANHSGLLAQLVESRLANEQEEIDEQLTMTPDGLRIVVST